MASVAVAVLGILVSLPAPSGTVVFSSVERRPLLPVDTSPLDSPCGALDAGAEDSMASALGNWPFVAPSLSIAWRLASG